MAATRKVERETKGRCTGTSRWELELEKKGSRIEVEIEIDTRNAGRRWRVEIFHNNARFLSSIFRTDRTGEIDVERIRKDRPGTDRFRFRAVDLASGEVCTGSLGI